MVEIATPDEVAASSATPASSAASYTPSYMPERAAEIADAAIARASTSSKRVTDAELTDRANRAEPSARGGQNANIDDDIRARAMAQINRSYGSATQAFAQVAPPAPPTPALESVAPVAAAPAVSAPVPAAPAAPAVHEIVMQDATIRDPRSESYVATVDLTAPQLQAPPPVAAASEPLKPIGQIAPVATLPQVPALRPASFAQGADNGWRNGVNQTMHVLGLQSSGRHDGSFIRMIDSFNRMAGVIGQRMSGPQQAPAQQQTTRRAPAAAAPVGPGGDGP